MQSEIEKKVMGSVAAIYAGRKLMSATALKLYILCFSLIASASLVSVPHVFANLMHVGVNGAGAFALGAILKTKIFVQIGLLVGALTALSFLADLFKRDRVSAQRWA